MEVTDEIKQVIIIRKDLKMRKGKMITQAVHSFSMTVIPNLNKGNTQKWLNEGQKKITCSVDSEEEMIELFNQAEASGLICAIVTDAGLTEFNGPTKTALAIGPGRSDKINKITGNLKLL